jgi:hypothetical protein
MYCQQLDKVYVVRKCYTTVVNRNLIILQQDDIKISEKLELELVALGLDFIVSDWHFLCLK